MSIVFHKGHRFAGPDGQFYELTRDVMQHERVKADQFKPGGRAPLSQPWALMPEWLYVQIPWMSWRLSR